MASPLSNRQKCTCVRKTLPYKHNDGRNGFVPLSHSGNVVTRIGIHIHTQTSTEAMWYMYWLPTNGGCVPFAFCTGNYVFVASQNRQLCKRKLRKLHKKDWLNSLSVWQNVDSWNPQATHMPTFLGTRAHQTYIIKCRNKHVQSAVLMLAISKRSKLQPTCR